MGQSTPTEEVFDFPCDYQFKVFTDAVDRQAFCALVLQAVAEVTPADSDSLEVRESSRGKYVCVTFTAFVANRLQVESIYAQLRGLEGVRYIL